MALFNKSGNLEIKDIVLNGTSLDSTLASLQAQLNAANATIAEMSTAIHDLLNDAITADTFLGYLANALPNSTTWSNIFKNNELILDYLDEGLYGKVNANGLTTAIVNTNGIVPRNVSIAAEQTNSNISLPANVTTLTLVGASTIEVNDPTFPILLCLSAQFNTPAAITFGVAVENNTTIVAGGHAIESSNSGYLTFTAIVPPGTITTGFQTYNFYMNGTDGNGHTIHSVTVSAVTLLR